MLKWKDEKTFGSLYVDSKREETSSSTDPKEKRPVQVQTPKEKRPVQVQTPKEKRSIQFKYRILNRREHLQQ